MDRLLGLSAANNHPCGRWALELGRAEQKTRECGCDMRLFAGGRGGEIGSGLPADIIGGKRNGVIVPACVSMYVSRLMLGHCFGPIRRPAARRSSASACAALRVTVSTCGGPSVNAELGTWEPGPLAWLRLV
jgi:hypothetical protein